LFELSERPGAQLGGPFPLDLLQEGARSRAPSSVLSRSTNVLFAFSGVEINGKLY
jgi:hypothetical protein